MAAHFYAEQVGSLLRPAALLEARAAHAAGQMPIEELRALEDDAIREAFQKQQQTGIDIFTDGEMRRGSWLTDMADAVEGFVPHPLEFDWHGPEGGLKEVTTARAIRGQAPQGSQDDRRRAAFIAGRFSRAVQGHDSRAVQFRFGEL